MDKHKNILPSPKISAGDVLVKDTSTDIRDKISESLERHKNDDIRDKICGILTVTQETFSNDKLEDLLTKLKLNNLDKLDLYYKKLIEDIFEQYIFNKKNKLPELFSTKSNDISIKDMIKVSAISEFIYDTQEGEITNIVELINMLVYITIHQTYNKEKSKYISEQALQIIDFFDTQIATSDRRHGNPNSYRNNPDVIALSKDIRDNNLKTRYSINGPISLQTNLQNIPIELQDYVKPTINICNITYREKSMIRQILNILGGKTKLKDDIGIRIATSSITDSFTFYKTIMKRHDFNEFNEFKDIQKTTELIDFDDPKISKMKKRMDDLINIEHKMQNAWKDLVDDELGVFEINISSNFNNIKELLEYIAKQKNEVFLLYKEHEQSMKKYYDLLKKASIAKYEKDNESYSNIIEEAQNIHKWIQNFRQEKLIKKEDEYNALLKKWRQILILDSDNINKKVTSGSNENEKLRNDAKPFIKYIIKTLGGDKKLSHIVYNKKNGRVGSMLYLSSKIHMYLENDVCAEIAVLPMWLMSLGELIAPHKGYTKFKIDKIKKPIRQIMNKIENIKKKPKQKKSS